MMLMNQILDSSNLRNLEERSRPLKRSASVASLPTPPRTHHKRQRSRARSTISHHDSDSASEDECPNPKKRRTDVTLPGHDEDDEDENAFWTGRVGPSTGEKQERKVAQADTEESSPSPAMLRYRVKAPVSPPPSRRQPLIQPARAASVERDAPSTDSVAPVTPPRKSYTRVPSPSGIDAFKTPTKPKATKIWPKRDSPNNPFLVDPSEKVRVTSEWDSTDDEEEAVGEARVREGTPTPAFAEKPTITYVFRGQKATFHNPLYGLAPEVIAASKLPIDHPDFEAAEACPPKRLFTVGKRKVRDRNRKSTPTEDVKRRRSESDRDEASSGERSRGEAAAKTRLASTDGLRAGAVFAEWDEPARRAMGPTRSA